MQTKYFIKFAKSKIRWIGNLFPVQNFMKCKFSFMNFLPALFSVYPFAVIFLCHFSKRFTHKIQTIPSAPKFHFKASRSTHSSREKYEYAFIQSQKYSKMSYLTSWSKKKTFAREDCFPTIAPLTPSANSFVSCTS